MVQQTASGRGLAGQPRLNGLIKKYDLTVGFSLKTNYFHLVPSLLLLSEILSTRTLKSSAFPCKPKTAPCRRLLLLIINPTSRGWLNFWTQHFYAFPPGCGSKVFIYAKIYLKKINKPTCLRVSGRDAASGGTCEGRTSPGGNPPLMLFNLPACIFGPDVNAPAAHLCPARAWNGIGGVA